MRLLGDDGPVTAAHCALHHPLPSHPSPALLPLAAHSRPLRSFLFVFEPCNCLVLETPRYGHATWFFEMEEPMPVEDQVRRFLPGLGY